MVSSSLLRDVQLREEIRKSHRHNIKDRFPDGGPAWQRILVLELPRVHFHLVPMEDVELCKEVFVSEPAEGVEPTK